MGRLAAPGSEHRPELSTSRTVESIKGVAMQRILRLLCSEEKVVSWVSDKGDCLFMSCAAVIHGDADAHALVRQRAVQEMEANPGVYMPFTEENEDFGKHCARMRRPRQWGGMVQLQAIAETYRRVIRVYRSDEPQHRQLYTDYLPQRSCPINLVPMEILYDLHGSHY